MAIFSSKDVIVVHAEDIRVFLADGVANENEWKLVALELHDALVARFRFHQNQAVNSSSTEHFIIGILLSARCDHFDAEVIWTSRKKVHDFGNEICEERIVVKAARRAFEN